MHHLFPSVMALGKKAEKLKRPCNFIPQAQTMARAFFWRAAVKVFSIQSTRRVCGSREVRIATFSKQTQNTRRRRAGETRTAALCFYKRVWFCFASKVLIALGGRLICDRQINNRFYRRRLCLMSRRCRSARAIMCDGEMGNACKSAVTKA